MNNQPAVVGGIGFPGALTILFIALKLCGVIEWSWLWVLSPLWVPTALVLGVIGAVLVFLLACYVFIKANEKVEARVKLERELKAGDGSVG